MHGRRRQQQGRHFKNKFAFVHTLLRLFQFAEKVKCRRICLEFISWGPPQLRLQKERKIRRRLSTSSTKSEIRDFHIAVVHPVTAKKYTKKRDARAKLLLIAFWGFSLPSPSSLLNLPIKCSRLVTMDISRQESRQISVL